MSQKPETTFYTSVNKHLHPRLYRLKTFNPYVGGVPDMYYSGALSDLWVEYKFTVLPKRLETNVEVTLSPLQIDWLNSRYQEGRTVAVIVGCKEGGVIFENRDWLFALSCAEFKRRIRSRADVAGWITQITGGHV